MASSRNSGADKMKSKGKELWKRISSPNLRRSQSDEDYGSTASFSSLRARRQSANLSGQIKNVRRSLSKGVSKRISKLRTHGSHNPEEYRWESSSDDHGNMAYSRERELSEEVPDEKIWIKNINKITGHAYYTNSMTGRITETIPNDGTVLVVNSDTLTKTVVLIPEHNRNGLNSSNSQLMENIKLSPSLLEIREKAALSKKLANARVDSVEDLFRVIGLEEKSQVLHKEGIDLAAVFYLNDENLEEIGFNLGERIKTLRAIQLLREMPHMEEFNRPLTDINATSKKVVKVYRSTKNSEDSEDDDDDDDSVALAALKNRRKRKSTTKRKLSRAKQFVASDSDEDSQIDEEEMMTKSKKNSSSGVLTMATLMLASSVLNKKKEKESEIREILEIQQRKLDEQRMAMEEQLKLQQALRMKEDTEKLEKLAEEIRAKEESLMEQSARLERKAWLIEEEARLAQELANFEIEQQKAKKAAKSASLARKREEERLNKEKARLETFASLNLTIESRLTEKKAKEKQLEIMKQNKILEEESAARETALILDEKRRLEEEAFMLQEKILEQEKHDLELKLSAEKSILIEEERLVQEEAAKLQHKIEQHEKELKNTRLMKYSSSINTSDSNCIPENETKQVVKSSGESLQRTLILSTDEAAFESGRERRFSSMDSSEVNTLSTSDESFDYFHEYEIRYGNTAASISSEIAHAAMKGNLRHDSEDFDGELMDLPMIFPEVLISAKSALRPTDSEGSTGFVPVDSETETKTIAEDSAVEAENFIDSENVEYRNKDREENGVEVKLEIEADSFPPQEIVEHSSSHVTNKHADGNETDDREPENESIAGEHLTETQFITQNIEEDSVEPELESSMDMRYENIETNATEICKPDIKYRFKNKENERNDEGPLTQTNKGKLSKHSNSFRDFAKSTVEIVALNEVEEDSVKIGRRISELESEIFAVNVKKHIAVIERKLSGVLDDDVTSEDEDETALVNHAAKPESDEVNLLVKSSEYYDYKEETHRVRSIIKDLGKPKGENTFGNEVDAVIVKETTSLKTDDEQACAGIDVKNHITSIERKLSRVHSDLDKSDVQSHRDKGTIERKEEETNMPYNISTVAPGRETDLGNVNRKETASHTLGVDAVNSDYKTTSNPMEKGCNETVDSEINQVQRFKPAKESALVMRNEVQFDKQSLKEDSVSEICNTSDEETEKIKASEWKNSFVAAGDESRPERENSHERSESHVKDSQDIQPNITTSFNVHKSEKENGVSKQGSENCVDNADSKEIGIAETTRAALGDKTGIIGGSQNKRQLNGGMSTENEKSEKIEATQVVENGMDGVLGENDETSLMTKSQDDGNNLKEQVESTTESKPNLVKNSIAAIERQLSAKIFVNKPLLLTEQDKDQKEDGKEDEKKLKHFSYSDEDFPPLKSSEDCENGIVDENIVDEIEFEGQANDTQKPHKLARQTSSVRTYRGDEGVHVIQMLHNILKVDRCDKIKTVLTRHPSYLSEGDSALDMSSDTESTLQRFNISSETMESMDSIVDAIHDRVESGSEMDLEKVDAAINSALEHATGLSEVGTCNKSVLEDKEVDSSGKASAVESEKLCKEVSTRINSNLENEENEKGNHTLNTELQHLSLNRPVFQKKRRKSKVCRKIVKTSVEGDLESKGTDRNEADLKLRTKSSEEKKSQVGEVFAAAAAECVKLSQRKENMSTHMHGDDHDDATIPETFPTEQHARSSILQAPSMLLETLILESDEEDDDYSSEN